MNGLFENGQRNPWSPKSWKEYKISQQPTYNNTELLEQTKAKLVELPPIVSHKEVDLLKLKLKNCSENKTFVIQVGDCAERFIDAKEEVIERQIIFYSTLAQILAYHLKKEIVTIGRIAGQYAKPRSQDYEVINGKKIENFRGDIINDFSPDNRTPDPERMIHAYNYSTITINQINNWNFYGNKSLEVFKEIYHENKYELKSQNIIKTLIEYYDSIRLDNHDNFIFTSHEGLLLNYEECLLREINEKYYDLSSHFLWIGERTGGLNEAHVEFFRGVENPIGIKVSAKTNVENLVSLIKLMNPEGEKGKIVLITRFGLDQAVACMDTLIEKIEEASLEVLYMCDPNHGNTKLLKHMNKKVRYFDDMKNEVLLINSILLKHGKILSGIHLEASCFNVTECLGGIESEISEIEEELYTTYCDPRLNMQQTYEICDCLGKELSKSTTTADIY